MSELDKRQYSDRPFFSPTQYVSMNMKFAHAMLDARKAGLEHFVIGMKKDETPFLPTHFDRDIIHSGMGSSAQSCIDEMPTQAFGNGNRGMFGAKGSKAR